MKRFTQLFYELDQTIRTDAKVEAMVRYFQETSPDDAVWGLYFLTGKKTPRIANTKLLVHWLCEETALPLWMVEECYDAVGDLAETLALLVTSEGSGTEIPLHHLVEKRILGNVGMPLEWRREVLVTTWRDLNSRERFVWNKIITGNFRVGVAKTLVIRALALHSGVEPATMAHRLLGNWAATPEDFTRILHSDSETVDPARPYPFFLACQLQEGSAEVVELEKSLGDIAGWQIEWKWDGIRAQLLCRQGKVFLWSRGEELVTETFPEIAGAAGFLPNGTVLDGEILAWEGEHVLPFGKLQKRLGRKKVSAAMTTEVPAVFMAYDLLEYEDLDQRDSFMSERRLLLEGLMQRLPKNLPFRISPVVAADSWEALAELRLESRGRGVEGMMFKRKNSPYRVGRARGDWWKWKIDPFTIDAVLIYAQRGHGRGASLCTDYTFGVWDGEKLVPVAKANSGLTDEEIQKVDAFVRQHTTEKFGPVRVVKPELVFELAFEGIQISKRHKAGVAIRLPRMNRWRHDKRPEEADTLEHLKALL